MEIKNYNIHDILNIRTNVELLPRLFETDKEVSPDLKIIGGDFDFKIDGLKKHSRSFISFWGRGNQLFLEFKPKKQFLRLSLEDLEGKTSFHFKESIFYKPFHNVIFPAWPSMVNLIRFLFQVKILQKKHVMIHSASLSKNGKGIILPAWPGIGKSTTCYNLMSKGFEILGDEISLFSESGKLYKMSDEGSFTLKRRKKLFKFNNEKKSEKLEKVIVLKKGEIKVKKIEPDEIINMILASTNFEFQNFFTRNVFLSYCFLTNFEPDFVDRNTRRILKKALKRVDCYIVQGNRTNFHKTIEELV